MSNKDKLIVLLGPTAAGKTRLSLEIARNFNLEVISGDSMQIYRDMNILTNKATEEERQGIPHHMIDIKSPDESYSVSDFKNKVTDIIDDMHERDKVPFIVGGTGHYIRSIIYDYDFNDEDDEEKLRLTNKFEQLNSSILYQRLKEISATDAAGVHPNNRQRVIRMLVRHELSDWLSNRRTTYTVEPKYDTLIVGLTMERDTLYERINARVEGMFDHGLEDEVKYLAGGYDMSKTAVGAIGYKEFLPYFNGDATLDDVKARIQQNTRQFAKRQLTFFRNQLDVTWFDANSARDTEIMTVIQKFIS